MKSEITLTTSELKQALPGLGKVISKSTLPVLHAIRVQRDAQGSVSLTATDLESHVTYRCKDTQPGNPVEVLVPYDALNKFSKGSSESLSLSPASKDHVCLRYQIGTSPIEQRISCPELKESAVAPKITASPVALHPQFGSTLKEALQCVSTDVSRPVLHGACVDVADPKAHYIVGTNGCILFAANSFAFDLKQSVILRSSKFLLWAGFNTDEGCELAVQTADKKQSPGWVQLRTARWTYTTRQIEGNYPNWKQVVPTVTPRDTSLQLSREAVVQMLEVIRQLPGNDEQNRPVRLVVADGELHLEGRAKSDPAATRVRIEGVTVTGPAITAGLNRDYLVQVLRYGMNEIHLSTPDGVVLFRNGGRKCVVKLLTPPSTPVTTQPSPQPTEAAAPATPSAEAPESTPTEERKPMTTAANLTPPRRGNLEPKTEPADPLKTALERLDTLRDTLKNVVREIGEAMDAIKLAEKERKTSLKEVENVRSTLRSLQKVAI